MEHNNDSIFTKINTWIKESVTIKLISTGILILFLLIPTALIVDLIQERQQLSESVIYDVGSDWSAQQTFTGPLLVIPYLVHTDQGNVQKYAIFLPDDLNISGNIMPEERKRSIYKVIVYGSVLEVSGTFGNIDFSNWNISNEDILYRNAFIIAGISDLRGIKENIVMQWNNMPLEFESGTDNIAVALSGIKTKVPVDVATNTYEFRFDLKLNGSQFLYFTPVGKATNVNLQSTWKDPAFVGAFLPEKHNVTDQGFTSSWKVLHFNRNYPQQWLSDENYIIDGSDFGVNLLLPVDHYQKSYRSAKYAVLIISLTFFVFFFIEILNKKRIHPLQYILVGITLCVFYTLLLSLSEHIGFGTAYLISALAVVVLIGFYLKGVFQNTKTTLIASGILSLLYLFNYIILQLQDYALLAGSLFLFAVLAVVMVLSRNINWYEPENDLLNKARV